MTLAPIILFVYNRPVHTRRTIEALQKNDLATQSDLVIFSDAAKNNKVVPNVRKVRDYIKSVKGFRSVRVVEREKNCGLAKSIIQGVTEVINQYGKVIILEDDIVTSPAFLQFMNQALDFYENEKKVWHVSGWNYPVDFSELGDAFIWRGMNCWGWGTWADRWQHFEKNPEELIHGWSAEEKSRFDLDDSGVFWSQVEANAEGEINTWAIFWYATIFQNRGFCLNPSVSYVENIGHDGTGVHCGVDDSHSLSELNKEININFPDQVSEAKTAVEKVKKFYNGLKKSFSVRVVNKLSRFFIRRNLL